MLQEVDIQVIFGVGEEVEGEVGEGVGDSSKHACFALRIEQYVSFDTGNV